MIAIVLATEDLLSEEVGIRLAAEAGLDVEQKLRRGGNGYLRSRIRNFCEISRFKPVFVITDLDHERCPAAMIEKWFYGQQQTNEIVFRVAVREIESWLLADHRSISRLLGSSVSVLPREPDELADPKASLLALARRAPRGVQEDLLPEVGAIASQGLGYNSRLSELVRTSWDPDRAALRSPSLRRARVRLRELANRGA